MSCMRFQYSPYLLNPKTHTLKAHRKPQSIYMPLSKLLVSPLISPIVVPYIIPEITPFKEFRL